MKRSMTLFLLAAIMAFVSAVMPAPAPAALLDVGPTIPQVLNSTPPQHGFPLWYRDTNRVPLELCLTKAASANGPMCLTAEPNPAAPFSFPDNLGDEVFWWVADASINIPQQGALTRDGDAILVQAIEGAFSTGDVAPGAQVSFARIRIRIDTPYAGEYVVTTPFKQFTFTVAPADLADGINFTEDLGLAEGGVFTGALNGSIGPFLYCTNAPIVIGQERFVGDPNVPCTVLGSTFPSAENPTNFFRVQGPNGFDIQTTQFTVMGKLHEEVIPTPVTADRVTYARDATGMQVNAFATTQPFSNATNPVAPFPGNFALLNTPSALQLSGTGIPTIDLLTNSPVDGKFFNLTAKFANPVAVPATVRLTNTSDVPASFVDVQLTDEVTITKASYNKQTNILTVNASSSDSVSPPALQVFIPGMTAPLGAISNGQLAVTFPVTDNTVNPAQTYNAAPESITVKSAAGGSATADVVTFVPVQPPAATGVTLLADLPSPQLVGNAVTFLASGSGGTGEYEYRFQLKTGANWNIVQPYGPSATWTWDTTAVPAGTYAVQVDVRSAGSTTTGFQAAKVMNFTLTNPPLAASGVNVASTLASPQLAGANVTFVASGTGGSGSYEYRFWLRSGGVWSVVQNFSTNSSWTWNTAAALPGTYNIQVDVRNAGTTSAPTASRVISFVIAAPPTPASSVTLASTVPSPQTAGTPVTFVAAGNGGSGSYVYRFWLRTGGVWSVVQNYSTNATWTWNTAVAPGNYFIQVDVKNAGSPGTTPEASKVQAFTIN